MVLNTGFQCQPTKGFTRSVTLGECAASSTRRKPDHEADASCPCSWTGMAITACTSAAWG